jgi:hypothetical protein
MSDLVIFPETITRDAIAVDLEILILKCAADVLEHNPLTRLYHLPDSRDISPSDFYLFEKQ